MYLFVLNLSYRMASHIPALPQSFTPGTDSVFSDRSGFYSLDSNVPGLSKVILDKLNMKDYGEYRYLFVFRRAPFNADAAGPDPLKLEHICVRQGGRRGKAPGNLLPQLQGDVSEDGRDV